MSGTNDTEHRFRQPNRSNTNDFVPTVEQFGTVCLQSKTLHDRVHELDAKLSGLSPTKLTGDHKYLCTQMGTRDKPLPVPFLSVYGPVEDVVFDKMIGTEQRTN